MLFSWIIYKFRIETDAYFAKSLVVAVLFCQVFTVPFFEISCPAWYPISKKSLLEDPEVSLEQHTAMDGLYAFKELPTDLCNIFNVTFVFTCDHSCLEFWHQGCSDFLMLKEERLSLHVCSSQAQFFSVYLERQIHYHFVDPVL